MLPLKQSLNPAYMGVGSHVITDLQGVVMSASTEDEGVGFLTNDIVLCSYNFRDKKETIKILPQISFFHFLSMGHMNLSL